VELLGHQLSVTEVEVAEALDPRTNVEIRSTRGGPAPAEVRRMVEERERRLAECRAGHARRVAALREADQRLRAAEAALKA